MLLLLLFATSSLWAQTSYPVQVNVMVTPPNSVYLTDYYTRGSEKLKVQLLLKEVSRPSFPVKLRFRIEGSALRLNSRSGVNLPPFTLQGGALVEAAGDALAPYLNLNALVAEGADASSFQSKGQRMADGFYKIEVWAEEMGRSVRVSNIATTFISTMLYQSPLITTPTDRAVLPDQGIQNIIFQWMPRHLGASADVTQSTYYKLKLVEVWPTDRDPQEAIRSSKPLYEGMSITTTFVYGPSQPTLISGRRYALQVQAQDADQRDLFVGQGYSNVVCFTYGEECQIPQGLNVEVKGPNNATAIWNANPKSTGYTIAYRKVYGSDTTWKEQPLGVPTYGMDGLVAQSSYQVRVAASCGLAKSLWCQPRRFTTPDKPDTKFECGKNPDIPNITDRTLYPNLKDGDRIQAADFKVEVLTASLDNNGYSGSGIARIPFLRNAPAFCYFKGAKINKDLQLYEGSIVLADSVTVISKKMVNEGVRLGKDVLSSLKNKNPNSTVIVAPVSGTITATSTATSGAGADTFISGGKTTVTATTSTGQTATSTPGTNTKVVDDAGNVVAVSQNGTATKGKQDKDAFGKGVTNSEAAPVASDDKLPKVTLTLDTSKPYYGYDTSNSQEPWVSIETGKSVSVIASITKQQSAIDESAIRYRTNDGMVVEATGTNPATLDVKGLYSNTAIPILAVADTGRVDSLKTAFICGKINTVGYDPEHRRVWLVPVNGAKVDKDAIAKKLNEVYHQAVVKWDVQYDPSIMSLTLTDQELKGICDSIKVGLVANYTLAMQVALKKFGREPEERNYILFMVPGKADATGFMPLNRSAGFIYLQGQSTNAVARTVAHELGHGAFGLDHVGSAQKDANLAATDNLMDYNGGTTLDKAQWDGIHSEYRRISWFQGEDEGKAFGAKGTKYSCIKDTIALDALKKYRYFYLADGSVIDIKGQFQPSGFFNLDDQSKGAQGSLYSIRCGDYDYGHFYYEDKKKTAGFGYLVGERSSVIALLASNFIVAEKSKVEQAVRVFIDEANKKMYIQKDGKDVEPPITLTSDCNCTYPPQFKEYFDINDVKYVGNYEKEATFVNNVIYDDDKIVKALVDQVKIQVEKFTADTKTKYLQNKSIDSDREKFLGEALADKLTAYERHNGKMFIIVSAKVNTLSTDQLSWKTLAKKVFEQAKLPQDAILVTLPYLNSSGFLSNDSWKYFFMPGFASGSSITINKDAIGKSYSNVQKTDRLFDDSKPTSVGEFVLDVFKNTQKKYTRQICYINYKGDILASNVISKDTSGCSCTFDYHLSVDSRYGSYANIVDRIAAMEHPSTSMSSHSDMNYSGLPKQYEQLAAFLSNNPSGKEIVVDHGLNESVGQSDTAVCVKFAKWYRGSTFHYENTIIPIEDSPADKCFYGGKNKVVYDANLSVIDAAGIALSPVGLDWIGDFIGFVYSGYYGDRLNQALYGAGIIMPVISGGALRTTSKALLKGLATGESELAKEGGEYVIRAVTKAENWVLSFPKLASKLDSWKPLGLVFEQSDEIVKISTKNGVDVARVIKNGSDEILEVSDDLFRATGNDITRIEGLTVRTSSGENIANGGFVKNADGSIGFVEDVSSYGNATIQSAIKNRGTLRSFLKGIRATEEAHHVIPVVLLKENDVVKKAVEGGFVFNTAMNGLAIEKFSKASGTGRHASHPKYTSQIRDYLVKWANDNPNFTSKMAKEELEDVVNHIKNKISGSTNKLNDLNLGL